MASLLLSLHAYSHSGPATELNGTTADHGLVQVFGSSTVNLYSMVSASTRLKYSVIFNVLASHSDRCFPGGNWWSAQPACRPPNGRAHRRATGGCPPKDVDRCRSESRALRIRTRF